MRLVLLLSVSATALAISTAEARVVEFEILSTQGATFEARSFGRVGTYDKIVARAKMAVKPDDPRNVAIADISLAPKNAAGEVEFSTTVYILKPAELSRGNGKLFYDVLNRGRKLGLELMNDAPSSNDPAPAAQAGNGFLMEQGYTIVWSGWQGDVATANNILGLEVPIASGVIGTNRDEFVFDDTKNPAVADLSYPAADLDAATTYGR